VDESEYRRFLDTLKLLGVKHEINWGPTKEKWQKVILDAGYNITALACVVVSVEKIDFLFCTGKADWRKGSEEGFGPGGVFLLSRDSRTGKVQNRVRYNRMSNELFKEVGVRALRAQYSF